MEHRIRKSQNNVINSQNNVSISIGILLYYVIANEKESPLERESGSAKGRSSYDVRESDSAKGRIISGEFFCYEKNIRRKNNDSQICVWRND